MKDNSLSTQGQQDLHDCFVPMPRGEDKPATQEQSEFNQTIVDKSKGQLAEVTVINSVPKMKDG